MVNFSFINVSGFPKLGWVASLDRTRNCLQVMHGESVEVNGSWCVEGVWDGEFDQGEFHLSENFFGSGIAVLHDKLVFVPSSATAIGFVSVKLETALLFPTASYYCCLQLMGD